MVDSLLMTQDIGTDPFNLSVLRAISDWQRGGDAKQNRLRGQALKEACSSLPESYRTGVFPCFRQVALEKSSLWDLIGADHLAEKVSSWTFDIEIAKEFKNGVPPDGQGYQGVIFCIKPPPIGHVIINLRDLYKSPAFCAAMDRNKSAIDGYADGSGRYWDSQSEVVLEIDTVTQDDIYSLGGHSSPFEQLVTQAAELTYGRAVTQKEVDALLLRAEHVSHQAGPKWLTPEATKRVLVRTKPKVEALAEIKRGREAC